MDGIIVNCDALGLLGFQDPASIHCIITDPPFFISIGRDGTGFGGDPWVPHIKSITDAIDWATPIAIEMERVLVRGGGALIMCRAESSAAWYVALDRAGLKWAGTLTVLVNAGKPRARKFGSLCYDVVWYLKPGSTHIFNHPNGGGSFYSNVVVCPHIASTKRHHPAEKPTQLTDFLISTFTNPGDIVMDPFCGSGTTLMSARDAGRGWLGCDADPTIAGVAELRLGTAIIEARGALAFWIAGREVTPQELMPSPIKGTADKWRRPV